MGRGETSAIRNMLCKQVVPASVLGFFNLRVSGYWSAKGLSEEWLPVYITHIGLDG